MKIELSVPESFGPCRDAERVCAAVAAERGIEFAIVDIDSRDGRARGVYGT